MGLSELKEGELVLYITKMALAQGKKHIGLATPVVGIYAYLYDAGRDKWPMHILRPRSLALLPRTVTFGETVHPCVRSLGYLTSVYANRIAEMHVGKEDIMHYLDMRSDLSAHRGWISQLEKPYNLPKPNHLQSNVSFI